MAAYTNGVRALAQLLKNQLTARQFNRKGSKMTGDYSQTQDDTVGDMADKLAHAFAISPENARTAVKIAVPEFTNSLERLTLSRGGLADLLDAAGRHLNAHDNGQPLDLDGPLIRDEGNRLLEQMFDSKYKSRVLARRIAKTTGLDVDLVKRMLPALAHLYMDAIGRQTSRPLKKVADAVDPDGKFSGHEPLSVPSGNIPGLGENSSSPYRDLTDILRRGTRPQGGAPGGGYLWQIVRNILGPILGFQSKGMVGWIIRLILYRYGWTIIKTLFRMFVMRR